MKALFGRLQLAVAESDAPSSGEGAEAGPRARPERRLIELDVGAYGRGGREAQQMSREQLASSGCIRSRDYHFSSRTACLQVSDRLRKLLQRVSAIYHRC